VGIDPIFALSWAAMTYDSCRLDEATWPESSVARAAGFAQSLSSAGLIDQYVLVIQPVAFGGGLPLFRDLPDALRLVESQTFDTGTVLHVYEPSDQANPPRG
jgi:dihydrofolate reductase